MSLIENITNVSTDWDNARIQGSCKNGDPFHLNNFQHMDVATFNFFQFCNKTEDIMKHHNHDPTLKHQRT